METLIVILNLLKTLNLSLNPMENTQRKPKSSKNTKLQLKYSIENTIFKPKPSRKHYI